MLMHADISKLDYCYSLFFNSSKANMCKLQKLQNAAAHLVERECKHESISVTLIELYWSPVEGGIQESTFSL